MTVDRLELDGLGAPTTLAARIHDCDTLDDDFPIEALCRQLDIQSIGELQTQNFEAALLMDENKASGSILVAANQSPARRRFSIAHELGHFLIPSHRPSANDCFECSLDDLTASGKRERDRRRRIEAEANRFASHLLMPPKRVRALLRECETDLESLCRMAKTFKVSKEAMARAWTEHHHSSIAVIIARYGRMLRAYRSENFPWLPDDLRRALPEASVSAAKIEIGAFSETLEIEPDEWFDERDAERALALDEQVLGQRDNFSMILLQAELDDGE